MKPSLEALPFDRAAWPAMLDGEEVSVADACVGMLSRDPCTARQGSLPAAPEVACAQWVCRWFDHMTNTCYECDAPVSVTNPEEFRIAPDAFAARQPNTTQGNPPCS